MTPGNGDLHECPGVIMLVLSNQRVFKTIRRNLLLDGG